MVEEEAAVVEEGAGSEASLVCKHTLLCISVIVVHIGV